MPHEQPSPSEQRASVQQTASIVAEYAASLRDTMDDIEATCARECTVAGDLTMLTFNIKAETLELELGKVTNPEHKEYIGPPPSEVAGVLDGLLDALDRVRGATHDYGKCDGDCRDELTQVHFAISELRRKLDAWGPYI